MVFDADNTLWDTHSLFISARRELLKVVAETDILWPKERNRESTLQSIDRALIRIAGTPEYDYECLAAAAVFCFHENLAPSKAAERAFYAPDPLSGAVIKIAARAHRVFINALRRPPRIYPHTQRVLSKLRDAGEVTMVIFSEGAPSRVREALKMLSVRFDHVIFGEKNRRTWQEVKVTCSRLHKARCGTDPAVSILVGDSLHRDIRPGNQAGFITVYKPSGFLGWETPRLQIEKPRHVIRGLREFPEILRSMDILAGKSIRSVRIG